MSLYSLSAVPIGLLLLLSGLLVNAIQVGLTIFVLPFSRNAFRVANAAVTNSYWSQIIWLVEWWGCLELVIFTDEETWSYMGKESALVMCNHRSDVDWVVGWCLAQRSGCLGSTRALMKQVVGYLPVIGWSMWFSEYIFLARDFAKDQSRIKAGYERFRSFPFTFWLALFVEGTRFTPQKLKVAQEFAESQGMPVPKNTLVPRTKGFVMSVENLRDFVPAIVDVTVMVPDGVPNPTFGGFFERRATKIHLLLRRVPMDSLPRDSEGISKWCKDAFLLKDELLEEHKKINSFDPKLLFPMEPSKWPIFHTAFWSVLVIGGVSWALGHYVGAIALTWQAGLAVGLVAAGTAVLVQVMLHFTKSEYSTPLKAAKAKGPRPVKPPADAAAKPLKGE